MKRCISIFIAACLLLALAACKNDPTPDAETSKTTKADEAPAAAVQLDVLLSLPNDSADLAAVASAYERATGTKLNLRSVPASGYDERLRAELKRDDAPALFELRSPKQYTDLSAYCADLSKTSLYGFLSDKSLAITAGDGVYAIPYHVEGLGLLVNKAVTDRYFALTDRKTTYASLDEINGFEKMKALVEDMQAHKTDLGIDGVFAPLNLNDRATADRLRRVSSLPLYYEFAEDDDYDSPLMAALASDRVELSFGEKLKDALSLLRENTVKDDSARDPAAFTSGKTAMMLADTGTAAALLKNGGSLKADDLRLMPLYLGVDGEDQTGLCVSAAHYLAVNENASPSQRQTAVDFLEWLFSADEGKRIATKVLGLTAPFNTFREEEQPDDPVARQLLAWLAKDGVTSITAMDSAYDDDLLTAMGDGMGAYLRSGEGWDKLTAAVRGWTRRAADAADDAADRVRDAADDAKDRVSDAADDAKDAVSNAADDVSDRLNDAREKAESILSPTGD